MQSTNRTIVVTLSILAVIASAAVIYLLQSILIPFVLAGLLSIVYRPLVTKLRSWKIPMVFCLLAVLVVTGGALWGMYTIISISVDAAIEKAPEYQARIGDLTTQFNETVKKFSKMLTIPLSKPNEISVPRVGKLSTSGSLGHHSTTDTSCG